MAEVAAHVGPPTPGLEVGFVRRVRDIDGFLWETARGERKCRGRPGEAAGLLAACAERPVHQANEKLREIPSLRIDGVVGWFWRDQRCRLGSG